MSKEFDLSPEATAFLGTLFFVGFFLGVPCFGYMGDRYGRVRTLLISAIMAQVAPTPTLPFPLPNYGSFCLPNLAHP